jgi:hypothetical protein
MKAIINTFNLIFSKFKLLVKNSFKLFIMMYFNITGMLCYSTQLLV